MANLSTLFNGILVGASGYAMYSTTPSAPYAFSACALACCHGLLGLIQSVRSKCEEGEEGAECSQVQEISSAIMEIVPLPLINIELYLKSADSSSLALGHGLFIIPLAFDLIAKLFTEEGEDSSTETLKDLTILGNIVSLVFLATNEDNYVYGGMALTAFLTKYGSLLMEHLLEGTGPNCVLLGDAALCVLAAQAVAGKAE